MFVLFVTFLLVLACKILAHYCKYSPIEVSLREETTVVAYVYSNLVLLFPSPWLCCYTKNALHFGTMHGQGTTYDTYIIYGKHMRVWIDINMELRRTSLSP